jgi:hypothetical protein
MNRREKLAIIKRLIGGSIAHEELKKDVEIWMQESGKDLYKNIKSEETLTRVQLIERRLLFGKSRLIMLEFIKGKSIL